MSSSASGLEGETPENVADDVRRILHYAIRRSDISVSDEVIQTATKACREYNEKPSAESEAQLWQSLNKLVAMIRPATVESVNLITALVNDQASRPGVFRRFWQDPPVRRQISSAMLWILGTLVLVVFMQIWSLLLTDTLEQARTHQAAVAVVRAEQQTLRATVAAAGDNAPAVSEVRLATLDQSTIAAEGAIDANLRLLDVLTLGVPRKIAGTNVGAGAQIQKNVIVSDSARGFVKAIALYLLPLIYGILGANVYILRQLIQKLDTWSLTPIADTKHRLRRALGALLGAIVGLIFEAGAEGLNAAGFSIAALAFLGGYSSEFIFSVLDGLIARGRAAFVANEDKPGI